VWEALGSDVHAFTPHNKVSSPPRISFTSACADPLVGSLARPRECHRSQRQCHSIPTLHVFPSTSCLATNGVSEITQILTTAFPSLATNHHPTFHHLDSPSDPCLLDDTTACWLQPVSHVDRARWSSPRHRTTDSRPVVQLHMSSRPSGMGILIKSTHPHRLSFSSPCLLPRLL
jgi:hypothetical protein